MPSEAPEETDGRPRKARREHASRRLLAWYREVGRDLPWRRTRDPYRIWLSEVMLQQTRVETARPYYERFLALFPDVTALAAATEDEVVAAWSGLGYYRRARMLHRAGREIVEQGGVFPGSAEDLKRLPGIGAYTAAAVASIAFGEAVPVVDGNVERVITRFAALGGDPKRAIVRRRIEAEARSLLDPAAAGDSNQALMELGATLCTPTVPRCSLCPLEADCEAAGEGHPEAYPERRSRRAVVRLAWVAVVVERQGRVLLFRRSGEEEVLGGTWELPWAPLSGRGAGPIDSTLAARYDGLWTLGPVVGRTRHSITHRRIRVDVRRGTWSGPAEGAAGDPFLWVAPEELGGLATSSLVGKILAAAG